MPASLERYIVLVTPLDVLSVLTSSSDKLNIVFILETVETDTISVDPHLSCYTYRPHFRPPHPSAFFYPDSHGPCDSRKAASVASTWGRAGTETAAQQAVRNLQTTAPSSGLLLRWALALRCCEVTAPRVRLEAGGEGDVFRLEVREEWAAQVDPACSPSVQGA